MRKTCILMILMCVLGSSAFAAEVLKSAAASCRTEINSPTANRHDSSKLSIRSDGSSAKSWIKFDLSDLEDPNSVRSAVLRLTLHENEGDFQFDVSAVNDDCLDNIGWLEREITWTNAPANDTASLTNPDFTKATLMGTVDLTGNFNAGSQHFVDVTSALETDTDGIVQFILHNGTSLINCSTHDHPNGAEYYPTLIFTYPPAGADWPNPQVGEVITTDLAQLSWVNPDPNTPGNDIYCTVYLGTEPNRLDMQHMDKLVIAAANPTSVVINEDNFPISYDAANGGLYNNTRYYWFVDCDDNGTVIPGEEWSFETYNNEAPYNVDAGADQWIALDSVSSVNLSGSAQDDGLPLVPGVLSFTWTRTAGPETAVINTANAAATSVSFTERGDYTFTLTADDGDLQTTDTVRIVVGDDDCDASHLLTGDPYNAADYNEDCIVDLLDFAELIANDWLNCTDTLTNCAD